jgi:glycosyltransferase involved in cell wall biosynthesis
MDDRNDSPLVMHVITGLEIGGAEVTLLNLVEGAKARGRRSVVVSLTHDGPMRNRFEAAEIAVHDLGMRRGMPSIVGLLRLIRLIRQYKPDVVQGWLYHGIIAATLALLLSGRRRHTRLVHGIYKSSFDFRRYKRRVYLYFKFAGLLACLADVGVCNTQVGLDWHTRHGYRYRRTITVGNSVDMQRFAPAPGVRQSIRDSLGIGADEIVVISIARVDPMKSWDRLLEVMERVSGIRLLAAGRGTENFPPHPSRILLGPREDVAALLASADLFVIASLFGEGTSTALTEAMAAGLPVVVTDVGDNPRLADGCGFVVAPDDTGGLERAIAELAANPGRRTRLGHAASKQIRTHHSIERALDDYYRVYRGLGV